MTPVEIADYDPGWPAAFATLRDQITAALGPLAHRIEHVGSTAVPGLPAKPVIDLDVVIATRADLPEVISRLAALGYRHEGDLGITSREAFASPADTPARHLYVCTADSRELARHLAFRDYLRTHPGQARAYAQLKRSLAVQFRSDRDAYSRSKAAFIEQILEAALWPGMLGRMPGSLTGVLADAELAAFVETSRAMPGPPAREQGPLAMREAQRNRVRIRPRGPELAAVEDRVAAGDVPVRLYRSALESQPLVLFLHGGMWTIGDLESHDRACRRLAAGAQVAVLAVDYRRAPEHPWPAAVDDATQVARWAAGHQAELAGDSEPLAIAGDSSGANLAALACLRLRDEGRPVPAAQLLAYPNTDLTLSQPSVAEKSAGWGLSIDDVAWGAELWVPEAARRGDPRVSPLHATSLAGLPPALIVTAEHDPLRDEGDLFAARLADAGVPVQHRCEPKMIHGFLTLDTVSPAAAQAGDRFFTDITRLLATVR